MGKFTNIFRRKPSGWSLDPAAFQQRTLQILQARFGGQDFVAGPDHVSVRFHESVLGLQNLYAAYTLEETSDNELAELVVSHFESVVATLAEKGDPAPPPWREASSIIRPQFMPVEYGREAPAPLAAKPFNPHISVALVLDREKGYSYVRSEDLQLWGVTFDEALTLAVQNLNLASADLQMQSGEGPDRFIACQASDGYDAVRILIPPLRRFLSEHLGGQFFVGIPNRDFLICWAQDCSPEFLAFAREKVRADNLERPYPLTRSILIASAETVVAEDAS